MLGRMGRGWREYREDGRGWARMGEYDGDDGERMGEDDGGV